MISSLFNSRERGFTLFKVAFKHVVGFSFPTFNPTPAKNFLSKHSNVISPNRYRMRGERNKYRCSSVNLEWIEEGAWKLAMLIKSARVRKFVD